MYLIKFDDGSFFLGVSFHGVSVIADPEGATKFTRGEAYANIAKLRLRAEVIDYERFIPTGPEAKTDGRIPASDIGALLADTAGVGASDVPLSTNEERIPPSGTSAGEHVDPK